MLRRRHSPWIVAALGAALYLLVSPPSADLAAQEYRADLGLTLWNNGWFAGHHTPGYSVLFPPLGGAIGVRPDRRARGRRRGGAVRAARAPALERLVRRRRRAVVRRRHDRRAAQRSHHVPARRRDRDSRRCSRCRTTAALLALALAAATTLASPVAGLFVAIAAAAWALAAQRVATAVGRGDRRRGARADRDPARCSSRRAAASPSPRPRSGPRSPAPCSSPRCCRPTSARCAPAPCCTRWRSSPRSRSRRRWAATRRGSARSPPARSRSARWRASAARCSSARSRWRSPTGRSIRPCATSCGPAATRRFRPPTTRR